MSAAPRRRATPGRPAGAASAATAAGSRGLGRWLVAPDLDGPRIRWGIAWFVVAAAALVIGPLTAAVVYGTAAAVAAAQTAHAWRAGGYRLGEATAAGAAALIAFGALLGAGGMGLGLLGAAALAFLRPPGRSRNGPLANAGVVLRCAMAPGLAAGCVVLVLRLDVGAALALLVIASAYEVGDFLIGAGATRAFEGPVAGLAAAGVAVLVVGGFPVTSLEVATAVALGALVALSLPVGQVLASALLPSAGCPATALRRLDSLLVAAPVWVWTVGLAR